MPLGGGASHDRAPRAAILAAATVKIVCAKREDPAQCESNPKWRALAVGPGAVRRTRLCAGLRARRRRPDCLDEEEAAQHARDAASGCCTTVALAGKPSGDRRDRIRRCDVSCRAGMAMVVGGAAARLPAAWLLAAVTLTLLSIAPRFPPVAWACWPGLLRCTCSVRCQDGRSGCWQSVLRW